MERSIPSPCGKRRRRVFGELLVLLVVGCGRVGFTPLPGENRQFQGSDAATGGSVGSGGVSASGGSGGLGTAGTSGGGSGAGASGGSGGTVGAGGGGASSGGADSGTASGGALGSGGVVGTGGTLSIDGGSPVTGVAAVSSGENHTCAIQDGLLYCWGGNPTSALGGFVGASSDTPAHVLGPGTTGGFRAVTAGVDYGCALHENGGVWCWGKNANGELGTSDTGTRATPNPLTLAKPARSISGESGTTCAVLVDGTLYCWGLNTEGQAGQNEPMPWSNSLVPVRVPSPVAWLAVGTGQGHVCGIRQPGTLYCWGRNVWGQLGQGSVTPGQIRTPTQVGSATDWTAVSAGQGTTCGIRSDRSLWCWGDNGTQQLGLGDILERDAPTRVGVETDWLAVSVDTFHTCGIRDPGLLFCWGRNVEGQLGVGDYASHGTPTRAGTRTDWQEVSTGRFHTCARRADRSTWCAGDNNNGRLGTGNKTRVNALTQVAPFPP